jgi:hypothetical protein
MSQEKANLARIRDNQRRSRARRKEYLHQLEGRLRQIELQGIEASPEIQVAARRVADENRKLRGLLAQHRVSDDRIMAFLQSQSSLRNGPDAVAEGQFNAAVDGGGGIQIFERLGGVRGQDYGRVDTSGGGSQDSSALSHPPTASSSTASCTCTCGVSASDRRSTSRAVPATQTYIMCPASNPPNHTHQQMSDFGTQLSVSHLASSYQFPSTLHAPRRSLRYEEQQ